MPSSPKAAPYEHITVAAVNNPAPREETVFVANVPADEHKGALKGLSEYLDTLKDVKTCSTTSSSLPMRTTT